MSSIAAPSRKSLTGIKTHRRRALKLDCSAAEADVKIRVECYAGHRAEEEPRAFELGERRFAVSEILDRWLDPRHRYFKVRVDDGRQFVLRHDVAAGDWELAALVAAERPFSGSAVTHH